jgi:uncharacterized protein with FMN-binding domain
MRRTLLAVISTVVGLVMLLSFKTQGTRPNGLSALGAPGTGTGAAPATTAPPRSGTTAPATSRTVSGQVVQTGYGPIQVQITVQGGRILQVRPLQYPSAAGRSYAISSYAIPILMQETMKAQSAQIDSVSGASYTSQGYVQSLQSALDAAHA